VKTAHFDEDDNEILPREADLPGHLKAGGATSDGGDGDTAKVTAETDYAIHEALIMLKGLSVFGDKSPAPTPVAPDSDASAAVTKPAG